MLPVVEVRLVQLLASFIAVSSEYALARLEFALTHPQAPAPPVIDRLPDASENSLRSCWPAVEAQLEDARAFVKQFPGGPSSTDRQTTAAQWLRRTVKELDQYARAIRWVLTVTENE